MLKNIQILFMVFLSQISLFAAPVVPESVLSQEEIDYFLTTGNVFHRNSMEPFTWDRWERKYSRHYLGPRDQFFSLDDVIHKTLSDGFPVRYKVEELYRAGMANHVAWGGVVPRISLTLGEGASPINLNNMFVNLFGFLMPQHWMYLAGRYKAYKASKYLFLKTALDEILNAELHYLKLHNSIQDFEIINFYFIHLQLLTRMFPELRREFDTLKARFGNEGSQMALKRGETKLGFDALAQVMALEKGEQGDYGAGKINIKNLDPFPQSVPGPHSLETEFQDKESFVRLAVARSVELKSILEFYKISKLNIGITAFGSILENKDAKKNIENQAQFGINLGYDTLPKILIASSDKRTAKINVQDEYFKVLNLARRAHDLYTNSVGLYTESLRSLELNRTSFETNLKHVLDHRQIPDGVFLFSFIQLLDAELKLNKSFHKSLEAKALLKRLMVTKESEVLDYLPSSPEVHAVKKFFNEDYETKAPTLSAADSYARTVRTSKKLSNLLSGEITDQDGTLHRLSEDEVRDCILFNIQFLLHSKWNFPKSRKFYKMLYRYIKRNEIRLSDYEMRFLHKKSNHFVRRWFSKTYRNEKELFQDNFDFGYFEN